MKLVLLKAIGIVGVGGVSLVPLIKKEPYDPTISKGRGAWRKGVFIIAKSTGGGKTKLFVERKDKTSDFELKVWHNKKEIQGRFLLCSPEDNKKDYYLLKWDGSFWRYNLEGVAVQDCDIKSKDKMGKKLEKINGSESLTGETNQLLKEIDLQGCSIKDLREKSWKVGQPTIKLTCKGIWQDKQKQVELYSQRFENLTT